MHSKAELARQAKVFLDSQVLPVARERVRKEILRQIEESHPNETGKREALYHQLKAPDILLQELRRIQADGQEK